MEDGNRDRFVTGIRLKVMCFVREAETAGGEYVSSDRNRDRFTTIRTKHLGRAIQSEGLRWPIQSVHQRAFEPRDRPS